MKDFLTVIDQHKELNISILHWCWWLKERANLSVPAFFHRRQTGLRIDHEAVSDAKKEKWAILKQLTYLYFGGSVGITFSKQ